MQIKITAFFEVPGSPNNAGGGWSETWYAIANDFDAWNADAGSFFNLRCGMLGSPCRLTAYRLTQLGVGHMTQLFRPPAVTNFPISLSAADRPGSAALLTFGTGQGAQRQMEMRGTPDAIFDFADPFNAGYLQFLTNFNLWRSYLLSPLNIGLNVRSLDRTTFPKSPITSVSVNPTTRILTVTLPAAYTIAVGDKFKLYNVQGWNPPLGFHTVTNIIAGPPWQVQAMYDGNQGPDATVKSKFMKATYNLVAVTSINWLRSTNKKIGRPFNQARGRAPNRS